MTAEARARSCVGVPFRLHGRDPAFGLDCVGLAAFAWEVAAPADYPIRCDDVARLERALRAAGLARADTAAAGDVGLFRPAAGQIHLAILCDGAIVHADAAARRVVARPGAPPWPCLSRWRRG